MGIYEDTVTAGNNEKMQLGKNATRFKEVRNLTFNREDRYFYFSRQFPNGTLVLNEEWEVVDENWNWRTPSLRAASLFRENADETAKKVFNRAFQKFYDPPPLSGNALKFLDPHQLEGIKWALTRSRSYLAHAPGAGKTAEAIIASCLVRAHGQTVFIVPPSLTLNWEREIWAFTEHLGIWPTIGIVPSTAKKSEMAWRADFIICPDSMLTRSWVYEPLSKMKIKFLAVDEASRFKESTSDRSKAFYGGKSQRAKYPGLFQNARHVVLLDGSPMPNRPMELWAPTYALDPEAIDCMNQRDFGFRYCGPTQNQFGQYEFKHSSNEAELKQRLQKSFMHVVTEDQLSHPERLRSMLFMNQDVRSPEQKTWERRHLKTLKFSEISEDMNQGKMAHFRKELGIRKAPWVAKYILDRFKAKNESILLFVWHREVAQTLTGILFRELGGKVGLVIGGTDERIREGIFAGFQKGKLKIIVGNIQAMGRGHNLQRADRVVFGEPSWSDELNKQCEKRASRRGSKKLSVRCEYVVAPGSMDEPIMNSLFTKQDRVRKVIG